MMLLYQQVGKKQQHKWNQKANTSHLQWFTVSVFGSSVVPTREAQILQPAASSSTEKQLRDFFRRYVTHDNVENSDVDSFFSPDSPYATALRCLWVLLKRSLQFSGPNTSIRHLFLWIVPGFSLKEAKLQKQRT